MNCCTEINEVWYSKISWTYPQALFESLFCLTQLLHMVQYFEAMMGQMLNCSVMSYLCKLFKFLLNYIRKVGRLDVFRTSCLKQEKQAKNVTHLPHASL
jgi:hypothetical protein